MLGCVHWVFTGLVTYRLLLATTPHLTYRRSCHFSSPPERAPLIEWTPCRRVVEFDP